MWFFQFTDILKRISKSETLKDFKRSFLLTEDLLPLTLEDICSICPMTNFEGNEDRQELQKDNKIGECRKRYFAALMHSYLGKPGEHETDWLDSFLRKCETCYLRVFIGSGSKNIIVESDKSAISRETLSQHSQVNHGDTRNN